MDNQNKTDKKQVEQRAPRMNDYSPNTMMIMGALFSGGDPLKIAKMFCELQDSPPKKADI